MFYQRSPLVRPIVRYNKQVNQARLPVLSSFIALAAVVPALAATEAGPDQTLSFVHKTCNACHNAGAASGGIDFATLTDSKTFSDNRPVWERALAKLKAGEMPPPGIPKPAAADVSAATAWLTSEFARQDAAVKPEP